MTADLCEQLSSRDKTADPDSSVACGVMTVSVHSAFIIGIFLSSRAMTSQLTTGLLASSCLSSSPEGREALDVAYTCSGTCSWSSNMALFHGTFCVLFLEVFVIHK